MWKGGGWCTWGERNWVLLFDVVTTGEAEVSDPMPLQIEVEALTLLELVSSSLLHQKYFKKREMQLTW